MVRRNNNISKEGVFGVRQTYEFHSWWRVEWNFLRVHSLHTSTKIPPIPLEWVISQSQSFAFGTKMVRAAAAVIDDLLCPLPTGIRLFSFWEVSIVSRATVWATMTQRDWHG